MLKPRRTRRKSVARKRSRRANVCDGMVETMNSTVDGEGRRVRRWGNVVSISQEINANIGYQCDIVEGLELC